MNILKYSLFFKMVNFILIMGRLKVGKSSLACGLLKENPDFTIFHLADRIRAEVLELNPWIYDGKQFRKLSVIIKSMGWDLAKNIPEVRSLLQTYGEKQKLFTSITRWLDHLGKKKPATTTIIADVRCEEELDYIYSFNQPEEVLTIFLLGNEDKVDTHKTESLTAESVQEILNKYNTKLNVIKRKPKDRTLAEVQAIVKSLQN